MREGGSNGKRVWLLGDGRGDKMEGVCGCEK